eukprot:5447382-Alexandrium_andersonii.AAC.1
MARGLPAAIFQKSFQRRQGGCESSSQVLATIRASVVPCPGMPARASWCALECPAAICAS